MQTYEQGSLWSLTHWSVNLLNLLFSFSIFKIVTPQCKCGRMSVGEFLMLGKRQIIHLEACFDVQKKEGLRLGNKLCHRHINWKSNVVKAETAAQISSSCLAYVIRYCRDTVKLPEFQGSKGTCEYIITLDRLFDLLNSSNHQSCLQVKICFFHS